MLTALLINWNSPHVYFFQAVAVGCFRMAAIPLLRGIMSKMTPPHKQGISYISKCKKKCVCILQ